VYAGISGNKRIYAGLLKERNVHLKKRVKYQSYNILDFVGFHFSCIFVSGSLSMLHEP
jgi:hypothetical protein